MSIRQYFFVFMLYAMLLPLAQAKDSGGIKGQVDFCGQGGLDGMMVYISGKQFNVITDSSGKFEFNFLPAGSYDIYYRYNGKRLNYNKGIVVNSNTFTDLSVIAMCDPSISTIGDGTPIPPENSTSTVEKQASPAVQQKQFTAPTATNIGTVDNDGDGFPATQDCNDNDATIRPGALELCDGKDNNCDGEIDENASFQISNGVGNCDGGVISVQSCRKNYANCDGKSENGCETDLN
ncbi:MAG: MopE-related protein, partial [Thiohalomonadales bacterium]